MSGEWILAIFAMLTSLATTVLGILYARNLANKDEEKKKWRDSVEIRVSKIEDKSHEQDLSIKDNITRSEMSSTIDKVFTEIKELRADMDLKFQSFQASVLEAIGRRG